MVTSIGVTLLVERRQGSKVGVVLGDFLTHIGVKCLLFRLLLNTDETILHHLYPKFALLGHSVYSGCNR